MGNYDSVFDVIGHIIVGPSSSHTAGACRIGYIANKIFGGIPTKVQILLHGSFAETYRGHKTDVALVAGLLGFTAEDERIPFSFKLAQEKGMNFRIEKVDLGSEYHPNSVKLILEGKSDSRKVSIVGSSIGGGNIEITEINGLEAGFDGDSPTLIEIHEDKPGALAKIVKIISDHGHNIKEMHLSNDIRKKIALSWLELGSEITEKLIAELTEVEEMMEVRFINV